VVLILLIFGKKESYDLLKQVIIKNEYMLITETKMWKLCE